MTVRTVLILSRNFPPSTLAKMHRTRLLATHLPRLGWGPIVPVDEAFHKKRLDPSFALLRPAEPEIIRFRPLPIGPIRPFESSEAWQ